MVAISKHRYSFLKNSIAAVVAVRMEDIYAALAFVDIHKMRCHIINCLTALHFIEIECDKSESVGDDDSYEVVKRRVFNTAMSMIGGDEYYSKEAVFKTILSGFPLSDEAKIIDEISWLPYGVWSRQWMRTAYSR